MYYQLIYLTDENEATYGDFGTTYFDFGTEFAIVLYDSAKKPFAFIGLEYKEFDRSMGQDLTLTEVIYDLCKLGFKKYASHKSAKKLREEVNKRRDISHYTVDTGKQCDFYNYAKDTIFNRRVYDLKIIDNKTREVLFTVENYDFNNDKPSYKIIAKGIKKYTISYYDTKEYEEDCKLREEKLQRQLEEEEKAREQERIRAEAEALVRAEEKKRIEELIQSKIKELENQERI